MKKRIKDFFIILLMTYTLALGADRIMSIWLLRIAFPESITLEDFYWEDIAFKLRPDVKKENRIILVNIGSGGRREIAKQVEVISKFHPKVIGVDVFFNCDGGLRDSINCPQLLDTLGNIMLSDAFQKAKNVVFISGLKNKSTTRTDIEDQYDSIEYSDYAFTKNASHGFSNVVTIINKELDVKECRSIVPQLDVNKKKENSFAVQVAMLFDSAKTLRFLDRNHEVELINFKGNVTPYEYDLGSKIIIKTPYFDTVEGDSLMNEVLLENVFKDKIVLIGYLGDHLNDPAYESKFYTPLNPTLAGRSFPDMLGLVLHANVISMILNGDYINHLGVFWENFLLLIVISLNVLWFIHLYQRNTFWYDSLCFIIPVVQIIVFSWLRMELFSSFNFRLDFQNLIYLIAFVSFSTNLYFGPILNFYGNLQKLKIQSASDKEPQN